MRESVTVHHVFDWSWPSTLPLLVVLLAAVTGVVVMKRMRAESRGLPSRERHFYLVVGSLRLALLLLGGVLLFRPGLHRTLEGLDRPPLTLLVDRSPSVEKIVEAFPIDAWARQIRDSLEPYREVSLVEYTGSTREALEAIVPFSKRHPAASAVLLTDGRGFLAPKSSPVPIYALDPRGAEGTIPLTLSDVDVPAQGLRGDPMTLSFSLYGEPEELESTLVEVWEDGERCVFSRPFRDLTLGTSPGTLDAPLSRGALTFSLEAPGLHLLELRAVASGITSERPFVVDVLPGKIDVLYIDQVPSWTFRFLKGSLIRDPGIALQTYLIDSTPPSPQDASPGIEPLTQFPGWEEIRRVDVVLLGELDPSRRESPILARQLYRFVEESGGGLVLLAGRSYPPSSLRGTPLEDCFPVHLPERGEGWVRCEPFSLHTTPEGSTSDVLRLFSDVAENSRHWTGTTVPPSSRPPGFTGYPRLGRSKLGARVLAVHPRDESPLLVEQGLGKGRVLFVGLDELWRWRYGREDEIFHRFFAQGLRSTLDLGRKSERTSGRLVADRRNAHPGDTVRFSWRGVRPSPAIRVEWFVAGETGRPNMTASLPPPDPGSSWTLPEEEGLVVAHPSEGGHPCSVWVEPFAQESVSLPRPDALGRFVASTGGELFHPDEIPELEPRLPSTGERRLRGDGFDPLFAIPFVFWSLLLLYCGEWIARRFLALP